MDDNLNHEDLTPESAHLVKALMDPYRTPMYRDENESAAFDWAASKDFTVEVGQRQIHQYIKTWDLPPAWIYGLDYLGVTKEEFFTFYHYRARFSTPTAQRPIVGTASVYFAVNKVNPQTQPVDVHFVIESNRLVNRAGCVVFREKWLTDANTFISLSIFDSWASLP
uniref:Uncharacterized protein n=1 Tax=Neogobius melanostomus TaxID=47308 RepID=A0A8C6TXJ5_9GOBI